MLQLPPTFHWLQMELHYNWGRQTTLQGFWRLAIQGHAVGETAASPARIWRGPGPRPLGSHSPSLHVRSRGGDAASRRRLIAAAIAATPLDRGTYYMDYDLLLLAVAAVLSLAAQPPRSGGLMEKAIVAGWVMVAVAALYGNPFVAGDGRWNVAVIAIAGMAALLIRNAFINLPFRVTTADRPCPSAPASALSR